MNIEECSRCGHDVTENEANELEHIGADSGVVYIRGHLAARKQSCHGEGERPPRGIDEHILRTRGLVLALWHTSQHAPEISS